MADVNVPRKRNASERDTSREVTDESSPIITDAHSTRKDYNTVSPSISVRDQSAASTSNGNAISASATAPAQPDHERQGSAEREAAETERRERGWWRTFWEKYGSVELENKGSVARDHLALERTFLAWLRTSLSFASIGIAITQLFRLNTNLAPSHQSSHSASHPDFALASHDPNSTHMRLRHLGKPLGAAFLGISILMLFLGFHRYFEAQHYVIRGKFPASRGSIIIVSVVAGVLIVASLIIILATAPMGSER